MCNCVYRFGLVRDSLYRGIRVLDSRTHGDGADGPVQSLFVEI